MVDVPFSSSSQAMCQCCPHSAGCTSPLVSSLRKHPHGHTQMCLSPPG